MGVAQFGSALEWGSRGRGFKSLHPYQNLLEYSGRFYFFTLHFSLKDKNTVLEVISNS